VDIYIYIYIYIYICIRVTACSNAAGQLLLPILLFRTSTRNKSSLIAYPSFRCVDETEIVIRW
jgi:hypothetical protein